MSEYRYQFKKYRSPSDKETCPSCDHKRTFTRYVDTVTGELLPDEYGRCERVNNCGYELSPYKDGYAKMIWQQEKGQQVIKPLYKPPRPTPPPPPKPVFIPNDVKEATLKAYEQNNFVKYLHTLFDALDVKQVTERYQIGTSNRWPGATVFWLTDIDGNVRAGQVKHFDHTGHTVKDQTSQGNKPRTTWVHSILEFNHPLPWPQWLRDYINKRPETVSCLFGEHLLKQEPTKIVCLVEAPKTAVIASLYFPQYVWLASIALGYLTADRCKALEGRKVILWPDLNGYDLWQKKSTELSAERWKVSDLLENIATNEERSKGLDLADYLIGYNYKDFILGYPREWNESLPVSYVPMWSEHTPYSLGIIKATLPPLTEQDLLNLRRNTGEPET